MLARNRDSCFRSCTLFGGQASHGWTSGRPGNFYI